MYKCIKDKYIMYKWMNVHIYRCLNPKYTHGQLYNVQIYNVQKENVPNMSAVLGLLLTFFIVGAGTVQRRRMSGI